MNRTRTFEAEPFDLLQYLYGRVHDPLIHCIMRLEGNVDEALLKRAVTVSLQAIPPMRCCLDTSSHRPHWRERPFSGEDIVEVVSTPVADEQLIGRLLATRIDIERGPQLKIYLIKQQTDPDIFLAIVNHMICDGAGFKEYLYLLAELYAKLFANPEETPEVVPQSRGLRQIFHSLGLWQMLKILFSKYSFPKQERPLELRLQGDLGNPFFVFRKISKEEFASIRASIRRNGITINDAVMTAYMRCLAKRTGKTRIVIPCPVDLRKYLAPRSLHGICNMTSNYIADVTITGSDTYSSTLFKVSAQLEQQKASKNCLKPMLFLSFAFRALPFLIIRKNFEKFFTIPVISYTNLGILDKQKLIFGDVGASDVFMTGAVKFVPYFQVAISTFEGVCTISCNLHGTLSDRRWIEDFLDEMVEELLKASESSDKNGGK